MTDLSKLRELAQRATPGKRWTTNYGVRNAGGFIFETRWPPRFPEQDERHRTETAQREADAELAACSPDFILKLLDAVDALQLASDLSAQEWQEADGKRKAATDNQGRKFWFISEDVMTALRTALQALNQQENHDGR